MFRFATTIKELLCFQESDVNITDSTSGSV